MTAAIPAACLGCGTQTLNGSYCRKPDCAPAVEARRHNRAYDTPDWRRRRKAAVAAHVRRHGWNCPGYNRPAHASRDLTADHPHGMAAGGRPDQEPAVLCRGCNSSKGAR